MAYPTQQPLGVKYYNAYMVDTGTSTSAYVPGGGRGKVIEVLATVHNTMSGGDAVFTAKINGTAMTNGIYTTTAASSSPGYVYSWNPSAANTFNKGDALEVASDGGPNSTTPATFTFVVREF